MEAEGFQGQECMNISKPFMDKLGMVSDTEFKPEYSETPFTNVQAMEG
jgi:hypothetical protein